MARMGIVVGLAVACLAAPAWALPILDLSIVGPVTASSPGTVTISILATTTDFELGGLSYAVEPQIGGSTAALEVSNRNYSQFGWIANDNDMDNCSPAEGASAVSTSSIYFDTVVESQFASGSFVDRFDLAIPAGLIDGTVITLLLSDPQASNAVGDDLVSALNGQITTAPLTIVVPEPASVFLMLFLGTFALRRR